MGSIVEFNCRSCGFTSGNLSVGWGKAGRTQVLGRARRLLDLQAACRSSTSP